MSDRKPVFLMTQEQAAALALLVEAAEAGDGAAACRLGDMYREALGGVRYSPGKAFRWYARSAMAGDEDGQNNLGACYEHGVGCAQSYANAMKWYRRSVAQGVSTAYMNLGYCYLRGHGVPRDEAEALRLFRIAVERGEERAVQEVERLEETLGLRGLELVASDPRLGASCPEHSAADTLRVRPWKLALGVPPRDGPPENLEAADEVAREDHSSERTSNRGTEIDTTPGPVDTSQQPLTQIRIVDETQDGKHFGLVGAFGVPPSRPVSESVGRNVPAIDSARRASGGGPPEDRLEVRSPE